MESAIKDKKKVKPENRVKQREKRKFDLERNSRTIFIGNLPNTYDQKSVTKLFKDCGQVESARIRSVVPEKEKLAPKVALITKRMHPKVDSVNAYLVFKTNENDECIKKALELNGKLIDGHHLRVDRAQRPKAKRETLTSRKKSVFVGNLRFDLRDDDLINHFGKAGHVNYVRIVRDSATGLGKGFGFVAFHDRASVKKAIELNDTNFKGRQIRVKKVEEEKKPEEKKRKNKTTFQEIDQVDSDEQDGEEQDQDESAEKKLKFTKPVKKANNFKKVDLEKLNDVKKSPKEKKGKPIKANDVDEPPVKMTRKAKAGMIKREKKRTKMDRLKDKIAKMQAKALKNNKEKLKKLKAQKAKQRQNNS